MANHVINGRVLFTHISLPVTGIRVEIWDSANSYGLIGFGFSDVAGNFSIIINDPYATLLSNGTITPVFKTFRECVNLTNTSAIANNLLTLTISENDYDNLISECNDITGAYISIKGYVKDKSNIPVSDVTIYVYESGFRSSTLIAQTLTDISGFYHTKINTRLLGNSKVLADRYININANDTGNNIIASSGDIQWKNTSELRIDLTTIDTYSAVSHFDGLMQKIAYVLGEVSFASFATSVNFDDATSQAEMNYLARAIGHDVSDIYLLVNSYVYATDSNTSHKLMYAASIKNGGLRNPLLSMSEQDVRNAISHSANDNFIGIPTKNDLDSFIASAKAYQVSHAKAMPINGETYTLGDVLNAIFGGKAPETITDSFLTAYNAIEYASIDEFWASFGESHPGDAVNAQIGLRLASITGYQPQMISSLMNDTADGLQVLATWTVDDWKTYIGNVLQQAGSLSVPASIIGDLTDQDAIKTLYAQKLRSVVQNIFPLTAINVSITDSQTGPLLIDDEGIRGQVSTFITNNPQFDLRVSNIYDIDPSNTTVNLTGITDLTGVQQAMGAFQRVFRVIGGNPGAATQMILNGHSSAAAISAMPMSSFVATYSSALGGATAASAAYAKATAISAVATVSLTGALSTTSTAGTSVVLPGGGVITTTGTHADPTLSTLFGNMSYCACQECLSVYSAAAYLTDILNFLREGVTNPASYPDVYKELMRRRPDLANIDMTCKNTNTVMPYIDLVIELLELQVLHKIVPPTTPPPSPAFTIPGSFQTSGTEAELAAHPEHVYKYVTSGGAYTWQYLDYQYWGKVYDPLGTGTGAWTGSNLTTEVFPTNLPFSLPAEETRTYLKYLGVSRYEMMKAFEPFTPTSTYPISDFDIYAELLGLTTNEASIIADSHALSGSVWRFYGFAGTVSGTIIDPSDTSATLSYPTTAFPTWFKLLSERLDVLIQQLRITYREFLQFFTTDFLNKPVSGVRRYTISSKDLSVPDTCDITKLHIVTEDDIVVLLEKLHRFVRLWRTNIMSIQQWDILFRALRITSLDSTDFLMIGRVIEFTKRIGIDITELSGWWGYIDIHEYVDYGSDSTDGQPSVYDLAFRNRAVINAPLPEFSDLSSYDPWAIPAGSLPAVYSDPSAGHFTAQIAAACKIKESDLLSILDTISVSLTSPVTFDVLSAVYSFSNLAKKTGYTIPDLLEIMYLLKLSVLDTVSTPTGINARLDDLDKLMTAIETLRESKFSVAEIDYLIRNIGALDALAPSPTTIQVFYENLRNELQKFPYLDFPLISGTTTIDWSALTTDQSAELTKLQNIIYQHFSKEFRMPSNWMQLILRPLPDSAMSGLTTADLIIELLCQDFLFTTSTTPTLSFSTLALTEDAIIPQPPTRIATWGWALGMVPELYQYYRYFYKIAYVAHKFNLNNAEFRYLFTHNGITGFDFTTLLPALSSGTSVKLVPPCDVYFRGLMQLARWIDIRNKLSLIEDELVMLLESTVVPSTGSLTLDIKFEKWQSLINRDAWGTMIQDLIGDPSLVSGTSSGPIGLLHANFNVDYSASSVTSITRIWNIIKILACCVRTGLKPATLQKVLFQGLTMDDAHQVLMAAKGKNSEEEWGIIAKPLRDTLRRKQRDALVGFVVTHPDTSVPSNMKIWRNENDLYAFLLIDVEMEACMQTSRIKQAICSVQLYIDRVLLGLETVNCNPAMRITVPPDMTFEWEHWRKWYRIWEANRQVFLYPENWIEPELRDDKSIFFKELEAALVQGDITTERAEDALHDYLRKVETVAKMEPIGVCDEQDPITLKFITHAFARTYSEPHQYYYRRLKDYQWTPWERIEIDIKGEHVLPIYHNGRLYLFWLTFRERNIAANASDIGNIHTQSTVHPELHSNWFYNIQLPNTESTPNDPNPVHIKQIEVSLNWTEYKDGAWQEQKVGKYKPGINLNPAIYDLYREIFAGGLPHTMPPSVAQKYGLASQGKSVFDFIVSRIKLYAISIGELIISINYPNNFYCTSGQDEDARPVKVIYFNGGDPKYHDFDYNHVVAPSGTIISDNRFIQFNQPALNIDNYQIDSTNPTAPHYPLLHEYFYVYTWEAAFINWFRGKERGSRAVILNQSPNGTYKLVGHQNALGNPLEKGFFYYDDANTFFARLVEPAAFPSSSSPVSLLTAADDASFWYQTTSQVWWRPQTTYGSDIYMACGAMGTYKHYKFYFQNFAHSHISDFINALNAGGIDSVLTLKNQTSTDTLAFGTGYQPMPIVYGGTAGAAYPANTIDFDFTGTYSIYNWETFFHVPLLVAKRLSSNQQFEDARKWFHYIFDPTSNVDAAGMPSGSKQRFWKFKPFYDLAGTTITTLDDLMAQINAGIPAALTQVHLWEDNPFNPHLIARMRIVSYMMNVVMCYLDNLIAWGDNLYRRDTIESINEATQLYILAANILGPRPQDIPKRAETGPQTFNELAADGLDAFSNALVAIEHYIDPNSGPIATGTGGPKVPKMFYYCLPNNPQLLTYWDTVENRLFNIRNCRNISGQVQQLPLFEPPIDPALLVRAAAAGMDASSVLDDLSTPPMPYRFTVMLQKANEICNDVKALGNALLSALEKQDAEALALLRSTHEINVLQTMKAMKQAQIDEAQANIVALNSARDVAQVRYNYYSSRQFMTGKESQHISLMDESQQHQNTASTLAAVGAFLSIIPEINLQAPMAIGPSFGGRELGALFSGLSTIQAHKAAKKNAEATKTITLAGYERRSDDWHFQADSAQKEIAQIEKQILAAEIRKSIAEDDLATLQVQISNAKEVDDYLHSKYTNQELYNWMVTQISTTYFQSYQLAYDVAKRAEKCLTFELPLISVPGTGFIKFGYWDSLKKGLLSADLLQYDLRKMDLAYLEANTRELELTKHISLALESPDQLLALRNTGTCTIDCDADMFNLDYPGHYNRRIKSVSISIPCVAGPYTTVAATLTQSPTQVEDHTGALTAGYRAQVAIATSSAQNDAGMFELNFRDERYLPFEGSGAICTWTLSMMDDVNLRQFDYDTISDVILHVKYTADFDSTKYSTDKMHLASVIYGASTSVAMPAYFSLKHQFANAWFAYGNSFPSNVNAQVDMTLSDQMFPYLCKGKNINIASWEVLLRPKAAGLTPSHAYELEVDYTIGGVPSSFTVSLGATAPYQNTAGPLSISIAAGTSVTFSIKLKDISTLPSPAYVDMNALLDDIYIVPNYKLSV